MDTGGRDNELLVFGRFELHDDGRNSSVARSLTGLQLGEFVDPTAVLRPARGSRSANFVPVVWVQGKPAATDGSVSSPQILGHFVLNPDGGDGQHAPHWEYDWRSGTSFRMRSTQHHFRVYVFVPTGTSPPTAPDKSVMQWRVVARATSPPFTFAVYRKRHELMESSVPMAPSLVAQQDAVAADEDHVQDLDVQDAAATSPELAVADARWVTQNQQPISRETTLLSILGLFCCDVHTARVSNLGDALLSLLRPRCRHQQGDPVPEPLVLHYINHCVPRLLALLPSPSQPPFEPEDQIETRYKADLDALTQICFQLVSHALAPGQWQALEDHLIRQAIALSATPDPVGVWTAYAEWCRMVVDLIDAFLAGRGLTLDGLVDELVTVVLADRAGLWFHPSTRRQVQSLLRNASILGTERFERHLQVLAWVLVEEKPPTPTHASAGGLGPWHTPAGGRAPAWSGRWVCRRVEPLQRRRRTWPSPAATDTGHLGPGDDRPRIGLLPAVMLVQSMFALDVALTPSLVDGGDDGRGAQPATLELRPTSGVSAEIPNRFVLDDALHPGDSLLLSAMDATLGLGIVDDPRLLQYRGRLVPGLASEELDQDEDEQGEGQSIELALLCKLAPGSELIAWRALLTLQIQANALGGAPRDVASDIQRRRRLHVRVQLDQLHLLSPETSGNDDLELFAVNGPRWEPLSTFSITYSRVE